MNLEEVKKQITKMDVKSDEFWDLYKHIADKCFTIEDPDDYQLCTKMILGWLDRSSQNWPEQVIVVATVMKQVFMMRKEKTKSCTGTLGFTDETFHFDIYTIEVEKDELDKLIRKAHESMKSGKMEVKGKFGKNYFKKEIA